MDNVIQNNNMFENILEEGEEIIKIYTPDKKRYWRAALFPFAIPIFWPHLIIMLVFTLFTIPFFYANGYKNLYYAYTNKRLIIRKGWIGVDYKSLEYKDISATSVNVGFLDKGRDTGTLTFSSPSTDLDSKIIFSYIQQPYQTMKDIKAYIDTKNL